MTGGNKGASSMTPRKSNLFSSMLGAKEVDNNKGKQVFLHLPSFEGHGKATNLHLPLLMKICTTLMTKSCRS
ncbi:hypothetical protein RHMOL_Rhmol10G0265300 [Rhododendron molle]|uniref:Uncharacterized protein n=1 Tax=Rhododendron molle TaxID=49168 RepID=A0ACC0M6G3_RHOML|nr:hypothetical protein RHMOL_Rhmol10G0265300 [Rhododendron molle]